VIAATAEAEEKAREMMAKMSGALSLPIAFGVTREQADTLGAWWEDRRQLIQPVNFVINDKGAVLSATYSTGPIGRLEGVDAVRFIQFQEKQKNS
jgi:hypothetical protein